VCDGFEEFDVGEPSPKFQVYPVIVVPLGSDEFVKAAGSPKHTLVGAENEDIGAGLIVTKLNCVTDAVQPPFDAVRVTEYVPGVVYV
jgi:hypothetical protein